MFTILQTCRPSLCAVRRRTAFYYDAYLLYDNIVEQKFDA